MTLYMLFEQIEAGKFKLDTPAASLRPCSHADPDQARPQGQ